MAVTADRVIVELEAKLDRYEANVRRAEQKFDSATRAIANDAKRMEREITRSSTAIGNQFRTLAATVGAAFSAQQVAAMADSYTRFTNQLRVAGLEGAALARVQQTLFETAQKNGIGLEGLGTLYGRVTQSAKELGASQSDLDQFTKGVAAALKIQGGAASDSAGALLQLSQALGGEIVRAEEFNSINEGARPILQAVANGIDRFGGSVAKLRSEVIDGKVTSAEFFQGFLNGSKGLEAQAQKATLTIGQSFTVLSNALTKYIGEADAANGASATIAIALTALADNLDTVTEALAVLSAVLLGRFVAGLAAGAAASGVAATAIFALQARAIGAATTMEALALTSATAGRALLAAFGGPVGLAVTALALGIGYLATQTDEASAGAQQAEIQSIRTSAAIDAERQATDALAKAKGRERTAMLASIEASRARAAQALQTARALQVEAKAAIAAAREKARKTYEDSAGDNSFWASFGRALGGAGGAGPTVTPGTIKSVKLDAQANSAQAVYDQTEKTLAKAEGVIDGLSNAIEAAKGPVRLASTGVGAGKGTKARGGGGGAKSDGRSAVEIERALDSELRGLAQRTLAAQLQLATGAEERAELERKMLELQRLETESSIKNNKDYSEAQKRRLLDEAQEGYLADAAIINAREKAQLDEEKAQLARQQYEAQDDELQAQYDVAETAAERRRIAHEIIDLEYRFQKALLESVIASETASEADKELARAKLAALDAERLRKTNTADRNTESPLEKYSRQLDKSSGEIQEQAEQWIVDELESIQSTLSSAIQKKIGVKDPILSGIIDLFIEQVILKPLADALASAAGSQGGGGGGLFSSLFSAITTAFGGGAPIPGRASGGHVLGGKLYRVNETGIEGWQPAGSGKIIPLGQMNRAGGGGVRIYQTVKIDASNSVTPDGFADHIVARTRQETAAIVAEGHRRANKAMPGRMAEFQRDGT